MLHIGDYRTKDKVNNYINSLGMQIMNNVGTDDFRDAFNFFQYCNKY